MPGAFTPDGSVKWFIQTRKAEADPKVKRVSSGEWVLQGEDTTPKGHFFKIVVRYPQNPEMRCDLQRQLSKAAADDKTASFTLFMPIEDKISGYEVREVYRPRNVGDWHIYVDWPVMPPESKKPRPRSRSKGRRRSR